MNDVPTWIFTVYNARMIVLFTDFGASDIYVGQMKAIFAQQAPAQPVIDLLHDAPPFDVASNAYLLAALFPQFPSGSVLVAVVDPGVGGPRQPVVMVADGYWFVGPDNGLLAVIAARARATRVWRIDWNPERLSASFHGRDVFAPIAAQISKGEFPDEKLSQIDGLAVTSDGRDRAQVIYVDHYGNCMTGIRAANHSTRHHVQAAGVVLPYARTFCDVPPGAPFWYENSIGLVEIAANGKPAARLLNLEVGSAVQAS